MKFGHLCQCRPPNWGDPAGFVCSECEEQEWRALTGADKIEAEQDIEATEQSYDDQ